MSVKLYDIFFSGQTLEQADPTAARQHIGRLFKADSKQLEQLFSGQRIKIKSAVDQQTAIDYRVAFRKAGAIVEIVPVAAKPVQPSTAEPKQQAQMTLLPANTGSLIDCAIEVEPAPLPNIDKLTLAKPGTALDQSPAPQPAEIETGTLELSPPNSGTLEGYQIKKRPAPLPDISRLKIVDDAG